MNKRREFRDAEVGMSAVVHREDGTVLDEVSRATTDAEWEELLASGRERTRTVQEDQ